MNDKIDSLTNTVISVGANTNISIAKKKLLYDGHDLWSRSRSIILSRNRTTYMGKVFYHDTPWVETRCSWNGSLRYMEILQDAVIF